ncbi:hypothetical protein [Flavobacterium silvaticum]|uniref:Uncharacterized protein n=1 Tax=Flavobacterium silvaticum TaxID=1852020 RepID=A0A972FT76_9FLAO|nr:hypothetical protein [Flavobacterium silvaticum]NMH28043.1 hypothetical protein [Flavobacterium silvaticum]
MIQIPFKKKQVVFPFVIGVLFFGIGLWSMLARTQFYLSGFAGLGLVWIAIGIYRKVKPYIVIDSETIKSNNDFFTRKIQLAAITEVNLFAGDLIVKSGKKEIYISGSMVDAGALDEIRKTLSNQ